MIFLNSSNNNDHAYGNASRYRKKRGKYQREAVPLNFKFTRNNSIKAVLTVSKKLISIANLHIKNTFGCDILDMQHILVEFYRCPY